MDSTDFDYNLYILGTDDTTRQIPVELPDADSHLRDAVFERITHIPGSCPRHIAAVLLDKAVECLVLDKTFLLQIIQKHFFGSLGAPSLIIMAMMANDQNEFLTVYSDNKFVKFTYDACQIHQHALLHIRIDIHTVKHDDVGTAAAKQLCIQLLDDPGVSGADQAAVRRADEGCTRGPGRDLSAAILHRSLDRRAEHQAEELLCRIGIFRRGVDPCDRQRLVYIAAVILQALSA